MSHEKFEPDEKSELEILADSFDSLQAPENHGRGVGPAKAIVTYLRMGDLRSARAVAWNEYDKLRNYPEIQLLVDTHLLKEWTPADES